MHELTILKALSCGGQAFLFLHVFTLSPPAIPGVGISLLAARLNIYKVLGIRLVYFACIRTEITLGHGILVKGSVMNRYVFSVYFNVFSRLNVIFFLSFRLLLAGS